MKQFLLVVIVGGLSLSGCNAKGQGTGEPETVYRRFPGTKASPQVRYSLSEAPELKIEAELPHFDESPMSSRQSATTIDDCERGWPAAQVIPEGDRVGGPSYNVALLVRTEGPVTSQSSTQSICTATWIGPDLLATAAHCIYDTENNEYYWQSGVFTWMYAVHRQTHEGDTSLTYFLIESMILYKKYIEHASYKVVADIAVLKVASPRINHFNFKVGWKATTVMSQPRVVMGYPAESFSEGSSQGTRVTDGYSRVMDLVTVTGFALKFNSYFVDEMDVHNGHSGSPVLEAMPVADRKFGQPAYAFVSVLSGGHLCTKVTAAVTGDYPLDYLVREMGGTISSDGAYRWIP